MEELNELEQSLQPLLENKNRSILMHACNGVIWHLARGWSGGLLGRFAGGALIAQESAAGFCIVPNDKRQDIPRVKHKE